MIFSDFGFGNLSCLNYKTAINIPETKYAPLKVQELLGRKAHVNGSLYHGAGPGSLSLQSVYDH
jgi:hypothetical protein